MPRISHSPVLPIAPAGAFTGAAAAPRASRLPAMARTPFPPDDRRLPGDGPRDDARAASEARAASGDVTGADLLPRLKAGDEAAFAALFDRYVGPLSAFVMAYVPSREEAADVVHDVFLRIWQGREGLEVHDSLRAYLYRAARNQALNRVRRQTIERRWREGAGRVEADMAQATMPGVEERLQHEELLAELDRATAELPERCRMVFLLRWRDGLRYAEIADVMGISVKTVENQITRALRTVRERLAGDRP